MVRPARVSHPHTSGTISLRSLRSRQNTSNLRTFAGRNLRMTSDAPKASLKSTRARSIFFCTLLFAFLSSHCDLVSFVTGSARCPDHKRFAPRPEPAVCGNTNLWQSKLIKQVSLEIEIHRIDHPFRTDWCCRRS